MAQLTKGASEYNPTVHAIERARQRFGIAEGQAKNWLNQLLATAVHVTTQPNGCHVYKHEGRNALIVVDDRRKTVVTIKPPVTENPILTKAKAVINRELAKAKRQFTREYRKLTQQHAEINVEVAYLLLNHAKCKQPQTQAIIQARIDAMKADLQRTADALTNVKETYENVRKDAESYIGGYAE